MVFTRLRQPQYFENLILILLADPDDPDVCVSTGDQDAVNKNSELKDLLGALDMEAIKLPPGEMCWKILFSWW